MDLDEIIELKETAGLSQHPNNDSNDEVDGDDENNSYEKSNGSKEQQNNQNNHFIDEKLGSFKAEEEKEEINDEDVDSDSMMDKMFGEVDVKEVEKRKNNRREA